MEHERPPIRVVCPADHTIWSRADWAGRIGKCPVCASVVVIPALEEREAPPITEVQPEPEPEVAPEIPTRTQQVGRTPFRGRSTRKQFLRTWNEAKRIPIR